MARALLENGHGPGAIYGSSVGALNGAWLAADPGLPGLAGLERLWSKVKRRNIFPVQPRVLLGGLAGRRDHTVSPANLRAWLEAFCAVQRLEEGVVPLTVVATDIQTGEVVLLDRGPAIDALMASSAMPGVFPPVKVDDRWLMDGGISCDTPLPAAIAAGATTAWVLSTVPDIGTGPPRTALDAVLRSASISLARQNAQAIAASVGRCEIYVVPAPVVPGASPFRFDKTSELIEAAYRLTTDWLPTARPIEPSGADSLGTLATGRIER